MTCLDLRTAFTGVYADGPYKTWDWNGMRYQLPGMTWAHIGFMHGPHWYPINWDAMIASRKKFEGEKTRLHALPDAGRRAFHRRRRSAMPKGKQLSDVFGYIAPHTHRGNIDNSNMSPDQIDYRLWCYDAWFKGTGIKGLYFDITEPLMDANVLSGAGYVLDLPDRPKLSGKVQPGFSLTKIRQFYKRTRQLSSIRALIKRGSSAIPRMATWSRLTPLSTIGWRARTIPNLLPPSHGSRRNTRRTDAGVGQSGRQVGHSNTLARPIRPRGRPGRAV